MGNPRPDNPELALKLPLMETYTNMSGSDVRAEHASSFAETREQDISGAVRNMKLSNSWAEGNLNSVILEKNAGENVVLVALHEGTEIVSYQEDDSITFRIIEGRMKFRSLNSSAALDMGQVLTLNEKVKYKLTASEETVLLMSILKSSAGKATGRKTRRQFLSR